MYACELREKREKEIARYRRAKLENEYENRIVIIIVLCGRWEVKTAGDDTHGK